jgi:hypothetical protein
MAHKYDHLRAKAIALRVEHHMALGDIVERLKLPRTTVYTWIRELPIPPTEKQSAAQRRRSAANQARYAAQRKAAHDQGWQEAPGLLADPIFRDFVVLYMAEGSKTRRNDVAFVNSDPALVRLANRWIGHFTINKLSYQLQLHIDHNEADVMSYWAQQLDILPEMISVIRKSNSGHLAGRNFRSEHGLLSVRVGDTNLHMRLKAWMDYVKAQW